MFLANGKAQFFLCPSMPVTVPFIALDTILFLLIHWFLFIVFNMQSIRRYISVPILLLIQAQNEISCGMLTWCWMKPTMAYRAFFVTNQAYTIFISLLCYIHFFMEEKDLKLIRLTQLEIIEIENYGLENFDGSLLTCITSKSVGLED